MNQPTRQPILHTPWHLSWDAILFILLWAAQFWSSEAAGMILASRDNNVSLVISLTGVLSIDPLPAILLMVLMSYLAADLWLSGRVQLSLKTAALSMTIIACVIMPTSAAMVYRHNTAPHLYIHDGAIQIEEAMKFLVAGKNPYVENYLTTPLAQWPFYDPQIGLNPALYHFIYFPAMILISLPLFLFSQATLGWYDQRFVYVLMLIGLLPMLLVAARTPRERLGAFMLMGLNPLSVPFFIEGRNDVVVHFWLVGTTIFLQKRRLVWAGLFFAMAAASKQTAWFIAPFLLWYVMQVGKLNWSWRDGWQRARAFVPGLIVLAMILIPFLLWDAGAFVDDTISYQTGSAAEGTNYPIKSLGLGGLLLGFGLIQRGTDLFPFSMLQMTLGGLALVVLLRWQSENNTLKQMTLNYAIMLFVFAFFSRVFNDNHLGFALTWLVLPTFLANEADETSQDNAPPPHPLRFG